MTENNTPLDTSHIQMADDVCVSDQKEVKEELLSSLPLDQQVEGGDPKKSTLARGGVKYQRRSTALRDNLLKRKQQLRLRKDQD